MESSAERFEGMTFTSSERGYRYRQYNRYALFAAVICSLMLDDLVHRRAIEWYFPLIMVFVWIVMSWLLRGGAKREVFRSQITIGEDHLDVVDAGVSSRIPWRDILYLRFDRSGSGHRRKVYVRARGGRLFTLLDPEQGELLELWAREVAQPVGVNVKVKIRATLNGEVAWQFALCFATALGVLLVGVWGWL